MSTGGSRVPIPNSVRKTIQHIKEITGNHSEDDIYTMLKECSMDPNETTQKLLFQDTFHEVKRKRDKRKENVNIKESGESRWRPPGIQGRGSRGGRGNYSSRHIAHDAGGRNAPLGKENGSDHLIEKSGGLSALPISQSINKDAVTVTSSITVASNSPTRITQIENRSSVDMDNLVCPPIKVPPMDMKQNSSSAAASHELPELEKSNNSTPRNQASVVYFSASDPVLVPSQDSRLPGSAGAIKREVGSQRIPVEHISTSQENKTTTETSEVASSSMPRKMSSKSQGMIKNQESAQLVQHRTSLSVHRPSSNYNILPAKEWKPKTANPNPIQESGATANPEVHSTVEHDAQANAACHILDSKEPTSDVQRKLADLNFQQGPHVIIPNHLHIPEDVKLDFVFGSFDISHGIKTGYDDGLENDKNHLPSSVTSETVKVTIEQSLSHGNEPEALSHERDYPEQPQSPEQVQEGSSSGEIDVATPEYKESDQEVSLPPTTHSYPLVHTSSSYNLGFNPTVVGNQLPPFESSESQGQDVSRMPSFVVPQPFDPNSYYGQFFRAGVDSDGRISPFQSPGGASKYNGNIAVMNSQSSVEGGNSGVLSTGPSPQQNSLSATQQPLPVYRQPAGMHITHYPSNYIPYAPYYPPFYVPPTALHQFLGNNAFPQQPQVGNIYRATPPPPPPGTANKYPFSQYKPGTGPGNSNNHGGGVPGSFGSYGSSTVGFNHSSGSTAANSTAGGDFPGQQYKENNVYISGQQTDGSALWFAAPGRDISGLHPNSFYNIPQHPHAQVTLTNPSQSGHGTFTGIYHPQTVTPPIVLPLLPHSQSMAAGVDMVAGSTAGVYQQQPQHSQTNWPNNC
ncbi:GBF-interacting protein 1-like isoform X2 [Impatiens glandulifera]|uniref:GBF-interacting protein 1-like isoform X2 n=1 Tax=Impatiens glandulifera TaxID=253017 RepID=UPI001FB13EEC|nr:GBF-interacting protein 1-like isoform X2 [Impatiens glandulifera]